jgi:cystathionine beta-lyase/cystathionine gamma-synthase
LKPGDHVILGRSVYGGTVRLFQQILQPLGISSTLLDTRCTESLEAALSSTRTKLVLIETPGNPTLCVSDIESTAQICQRYGALLAVDNTFLTGYLQRPSDLGADIVILSTTKFVEGHNTAVGGALVVQKEQVHQRLLFLRKTLGNIQSPFQAWLTLNGLRTLPLRLASHSENALMVASYLEGKPEVLGVNYPFLPSFGGYAIAKKQQTAGGGVLSFELRGGLEAAHQLAQRLKLCVLAENLGATETLITHPVSMTHGDVPASDRLVAGITDGLLRLSIGLEDPKDIISDLAQAIRGTAEREEIACPL